MGFQTWPDIFWRFFSAQPDCTPLVSLLAVAISRGRAKPRLDFTDRIGQLVLLDFDRLF